MPKFKVLDSIHYDDEGKQYKKGAIVEDDRDLDVLFANKFERIEAQTLKPRDRDDSPDTSGRVMDPPLHKRMKVEAAKATGDEKKVTKASEEPDFGDDDTADPALPITGAERPRDKAAAAEARGETDEEEDETESETPAGEEEEESEEGLGVDVSSQFADAKKADLLVFRNGAKYFVADKDEPSKSLKKEPMKKSEVAKYLKSQVK